ncbi:hypothetical protein BCV69DRAFT_244504 [Microstroma glucosiphilum]|uniref:Macrofage activating glyco protein n=1 Tax=Pseudomicrostroma glucosiphilum TaxID=1684307 RepID=A0A316UFX9_9BASI|nr:hypothetical protein BCV69DRAFT_244504 [Pseudomicrostroma glucosiphilum]PWN24162.1 hypothetical protein BCV69DRAFT_244504 [Pseudomicrostroma glucosiphilum]
MSSLRTLLTLTSLLAATGVSAQNISGAPTGNPSAASGQTFNEPTSSWTQWQAKPTYAYTDLPDQYLGTTGNPDSNGYVPPQEGYNRCLQGDGSWNSNSSCQTAWINSVDDFCLWGPPGEGEEVGSFERKAVAYCTKPTHGTRLIPDGTLTGVHFVATSDYVQVTGLGDFTTMGYVDGDAGGEMDPHGEDDRSNPIGGVVYTTAQPDREGQATFVREWTNFMSFDRFCFRACWGELARLQCQHIYDVLGCNFNIPANYSEGFEDCTGEIAMLQGIYSTRGSTSTFQQGDATTPQPHPAPSSSCKSVSSVGNGGVLLATYSSSATSMSTASRSSSVSGVDAAASRSTSTAAGSASSTASSAGSGSASTNTSAASSAYTAGSALVLLAAVGVAMVTLL